LENSAKTLLLVEDDTIIAMDEAQSLKKEGYDVIHAESGDKAIEIVRGGARSIDIVLMDVDLGSGMDGADAARVILKDHDIPIVFLSSHTEKDIVEKTKTIASYGYVVKNSGIAVLIASIKMAFKLHESHRKLEEKREALLEFEDRYRRLEKNIPGIVYQFELHSDGDFFFPYISSALRALFDVEPEDAMRDWTVLSRLIHPDDRGKFDVTVKESAEKLQPWREELRFVVNGEVRWYDCMSRPELQLNGDIIWDGIVLEITGRKRAEESLRESEDRFRRFVQSTTDYIYSMTIESGRPVATSHGPGCVTVTGYTSEEYDADPNLWYRMVYDEDKQAVTEHMATVLSGIEAMPIEHRILHKNGSIRWVRNTPVLVRDDLGHLVHYDGLISDITERRQIEQELRQSEERFRTLVEKSSEVIALYNSNNKPFYVSPTVSAVLGYTVEEYLRLDWHDLVHPDEHAGAEADKAAVDSNPGTTIHSITRFRHKDGTWRWIESTVRDFLAEKRIHAIVQNYRDITDRKRAEEALEKSLKDKDVLLKELQHRVKNNLNIISSLLGLETGKLSDDRSKQVFIDAQSRIRSMSTIYEQLYSSTELDKVDLDQYLKNLGNSLLKTYSTGTGLIVLTTTLANIQLDIKRAVPLGLIMNELMTNALKYAFPSGGRGEIRIDLKKSEHQIMLSLSDNGVGLPDGFNPDGAYSLGLRLVKLLTEQIDGTLSINSNKGTEVSVKFNL
jgi:PAS domain S-box-containing protein